jgi:hypothetical protein
VCASCMGSKSGGPDINDFYSPPLIPHYRIHCTVRLLRSIHCVVVCPEMNDSFTRPRCCGLFCFNFFFFFWLLSLVFVGSPLVSLWFVLITETITIRDRSAFFTDFVRNPQCFSFASIYLDVVTVAC